MLLYLDLDGRVKAIPDPLLGDAVKRVIDLKIAEIEIDTRRRISDAVAEEINQHALRADRQHREVEY